MKQIISANIKYYRQLAGITQEQLAEKAGSTRSRIGSYEEQRATPKFSELANIAMALGLSKEDLLCDRGKKTAVQINDKKKDILYDKYRVLPADKKRIVDFILNN